MTRRGGFLAAFVAIEVVVVPALFGAQACVLPDKEIGAPGTEGGGASDAGGGDSPEVSPTQCPFDGGPALDLFLEGGPLSLFSGDPSVPDPAACQQCLEASSTISAAAAACADSGPCTNRLQCIACCLQQSPASPDCTDQCFVAYSDYDASTSLSGGDDTQLFASAAAQCSTQCALGSNFACLGKYRWPARANGGQLSIALFLRAAFGGPAVTDDASTVTPVCDPLCTDGGAVPVGPTGVVDVGLSLGGTFAPLEMWQGHFVVQSTQVAPTLFYFGRPEYVDRPVPTEAIPLLTPAIFEFLGGSATSGAVVGGVQDCRFLLPIFAAGVSVTAVSAQAGSLPVMYTDLNQTPVSSASATLVGGGFFVSNVPPGSLTLSFADGTGKTIAPTTMVGVRAGWVTQLGIYPTPSP
jgi:hypothetical protein